MRVGGATKAVAQPLDCRVTCQLMRFRARSCMQNAACSQCTCSLLPRYKKHWAGTAPPPRLWFRGYFPAARRANRAGPGGQRTPSQNRFTFATTTMPARLTATTMMRLSWRLLAGEFACCCAFFSLRFLFAPTHDLFFSAIPTGLRFPVSIRVSNYVSSYSQPALTL